MHKILVLLSVVCLSSPAVFANETTGEKVDATAHDAKRAVKKSGHRAQEAMCAEGDAKCAGKKLKHRAQEGSDYTKDKAKEMKDQVD